MVPPPPAPPTAEALLTALLSLLPAAVRPSPAALSVTFTGPPRALASSFHLTPLAQSVIAASAVAAASIHLRAVRGATTEPLSISVDSRRAAVEFASERYVRLAKRDTGEIRDAPELWDSIAGLYQCAGTGFVRIHTNFAHHRNGVIRILSDPPHPIPKPAAPPHDRASVAAALATWPAELFESVASENNLVVAMVRSAAEFWDAHPQGAAVRSNCPEIPVTITRVDDGSPAQPFPLLPPRAASAVEAAAGAGAGAGADEAAPLPLAGVKVLDLTRIIAGPVATHTLALYGASVLHVASPNLPDIDASLMDAGRGKRSTHVDLTSAAGRAALGALLDGDGDGGDGGAGADVLVQGYRPGGVEALGFGAAAARARRPGIVYASLSAYSRSGPWAGKRGFDSLVQTATGFNHDEGEAYAAAAAGSSAAPRAFPVQALDHATGYLLAYGVMVALLRRSVEGGSWNVSVSLAETAWWLRSLGRLDPDEAFGGKGLEDAERGTKEKEVLQLPSFEEAFRLGYLVRGPSEWYWDKSTGERADVVGVKHSAELTGAGFKTESALSSAPNGTHPPEWW
ncbi:putative acyl-CoA transferase/carnitine dehydratase [Zopfochytrium polystomum]|nr:putative acyl-CoA transferase/carnitine dehydratase [Zopfochytrium polystomum]